MNHKKYDFRHSYCPDYPFWLYAPDGDGMTFWRTEEERNKYAEEEVQSYLQDGEWNEEVQYVCAGIVGYSAQECDVLRPKGEIDEEGYDEDGGGPWQSEDDIRCNYKLQATPAFGSEFEFTPVSQEQLQRLKDDCDIPDMPTQMTYHLRKGVSGAGGYGDEWTNKPHRLVYDACREIERLSAIASAAYENGRRDGMADAAQASEAAEDQPLKKLQ